MRLAPQVVRQLLRVGCGLAIAGAIAAVPAVALADKPEFAVCYNQDTGKRIEVPVEAAQHINGHGGWFCKVKLGGK